VRLVEIVCWDNDEFLSIVHWITLFFKNKLYFIKLIIVISAISNMLTKLSRDPKLIQVNKIIFRCNTASRFNVNWKYIGDIKKNKRPLQLITKLT